MGLDSRLTWFQTISPEMVRRLTGKNIKDIDLFSISESDYKQYKAYDNIRKYAHPIRVYVTDVDYGKFKKLHDVPPDYWVTGIGPGYVKFSDRNNIEKCIVVHDNIYSNPECEYTEEQIRYFISSETVYEWRRNERQEKIKDLFDVEYPEIYDKNLDKYTQAYAKYYPLTDNLLSKMKEIDYEFADKYKEGVNDIFYSCDW